MDYARIYASLIEDRRARLHTQSKYSELHHIVPRALGGMDTDDNLILLTAEDHFFAHLLLAKVHGGAMWYALVAMTIASGGRKVCNGYLRRARKIVAKAREEAGRIHSTKMKGRFVGDKHPMYGRPCSELAKAGTRARHAAGLGPMSDPAARAKISAALTGRVFTDDHRKRISDTKKGQRRSIASRMKQSKTLKGRPLSPEAAIALSRALTGKKKSPEHIEKMRAANIGKRLSEETKRKISAHWATYGHPKGMMGRKQSPEFRAMMTEFNAKKRAYADRFGVSAKTVTKQMIMDARI